MNFQLSELDLASEVWVPISGYEGLYEISNMGRVKTLRKFHKTGHTGHWRQEKIMSCSLSGKYLKIDLRPIIPNRETLMHRLVAIHFIPNPDNKPQVNHKKGNKHDNRAAELEWSTISENHLHAFRTGLKKASWTGKTGKDHVSSKPVILMGSNGTKEFESTTACAKYLGVNLASVLQAIRLEGNCKGHKIKRA
jgi:NUMOD4 motif-containing protein